MQEAETGPAPEEFEALEGAGEFWDTQAAAGHCDDKEEVAPEVDSQDHRLAVLREDAAYYIVEVLAARRGVQPDAFVNEFLRQELVRA